MLAGQNLLLLSTATTALGPPQRAAVRAAVRAAAGGRVPLVLEAGGTSPLVGDGPVATEENAAVVAAAKAGWAEALWAAGAAVGMLRLVVLPPLGSAALAALAGEGLHDPGSVAAASAELNDKETGQAAVLLGLAARAGRGSGSYSPPARSPASGSALASAAGSGSGSASAS